MNKSNDMFEQHVNNKKAVLDAAQAALIKHYLACSKLATASTPLLADAYDWAWDHPRDPHTKRLLSSIEIAEQELKAAETNFGSYSQEKFQKV